MILLKVNISYNKKSKDTVKVSVENRDLWDASLTLARVIYPVLKKYRKLYDHGQVGCPMDFAQDPTKPEGPDNQDRHEDWIACLDAMVYSFEWIAKGKNWEGPAYLQWGKEYSKLLSLHKKELKKLAKEDDQRFEQFVGPGGLESFELNYRMKIMQPIHEKYSKEFDLHYQKIQDGLNLFAKYFGALWT